MSVISVDPPEQQRVRDIIDLVKVTSQPLSIDARQMLIIELFRVFKSEVHTLRTQKREVLVEAAKGHEINVN